MTINLNRIKTKVVFGKDNLQDIFVNVRISTNKRIKRDYLHSTIDYEKLALDVISLVENKSFNLIESVANEILKFLKTNKKIGSAWVEVIKFQAHDFLEEVSVVCSY